MFVLDSHCDTPSQISRLRDLALDNDLEIVPVINKIDLTTPEALEMLAAQWQEKMPQAVIIPVSAKEKVGMAGVLDAILERLPEGEAFYPKDTLTDKTLRFFASEIIREKILLNYDKEIPYCCEIEIDSYKEEPTIDRIAANIYVARSSQKGIVIGHKGERLKRVGQQAREDMERAAKALDFLAAARYRDRMYELQKLKEFY